MGLLDNELPEEVRKDVVTHLHECPECKAEYASFRELARLTNSLKPPSPDPSVWDHYYEGVCRKMRKSAYWAWWGGLAVACVVAAASLFVALPATPVTITGSIVLVSLGALLAGTSIACHCKYR
jgi:anti-sigma factor RsiW